MTFAEKGSVDVVNMPAGGAELEPVLSGCQGFANIANWSFTKGGVPTSRFTMSVAGGRIRFIARGTVIVVK